jgi:RsiW-degrading membrane proteinase PrsW (M82 family)
MSIRFAAWAGSTVYFYATRAPVPARTSQACPQWFNSTLAAHFIFRILQLLNAK